MAIVISKSSALNDDFWKPTGQVVNAILEEADQEQTKYDQLVKDLAIEKKSSKYAEKQTSVTSLGSMAVTAEGADAPLDDMQEGTPKLIIHKTFQKRVDITKELVDDGEWDAIRSKARNMVLAYKRTRAELFSAALTSDGTTFTYGGATFDRTTGDNKALFATDHPSVKSGVAAQSNVYTAPFSLANLVKLANIGRNFKNESGQITGYTFNKIIIPGDCPELEEQIRKIIRSELQPGTANNDINTQKGLWTLIVDPLWSAASAEVKPWILMSDEANDAYNGSMFYDRTPLDVKSEVKIENRNLVTTGYARMGVGFYNWRHLIKAGAESGSTLA